MVESNRSSVDARVIVASRNPSADEGEPGQQPRTILLVLIGLYTGSTKSRKLRQHIMYSTSVNKNFSQKKDRTQRENGFGTRKLGIAARGTPIHNILIVASDVTKYLHLKLPSARRSIFSLRKNFEQQPSLRCRRPRLTNRGTNRYRS